MGLKTIKIQGADRTANGGALVNSLVVSALPGRLYSLTVFNTGPDQYIQVFDAAAVPANATVPKMQAKELADSQVTIDFGDGRIFAAGIEVCNSTTTAAKTLGAANCLMDATYRN